MTREQLDRLRGIAGHKGEWLVEGPVIRELLAVFDAADLVVRGWEGADMGEPLDLGPEEDLRETVEAVRPPREEPT